MKAKIRQGLQFLLVAYLVAFGIWLLEAKAMAPVGEMAESCRYHERAYQGLNLTNLSQELENTGLVGSIHGAVPSSRLFVLSVREPENFFNHREFSLLPSDGAVEGALSQLKRHDRACIRGRFLENPSPQKHIWVESVKVLEPWPGLDEFPPYEREAPLPEELVKGRSLVGKVHFVGAGGRVLVVEYGDAVFPLFVESPELTQGLFRGDIIRLSYRLQAWPQRPTHLRLDGSADPPIEVLDAIADWHGREKVLRGKLVKFPQSPQVKFDVYAIEVETQGVRRYFTLVNFDEAEKFQKLRDELSQLWNGQGEPVRPGRNLLIRPDITLEVRGRINVVSPEQANPQILVDGVRTLNRLS